jgi:hypothetical protein
MFFWELGCETLSRQGYEPASRYPSATVAETDGTV